MIKKVEKNRNESSVPIFFLSCLCLVPGLVSVLFSPVLSLVMSLVLYLPLSLVLYLSILVPSLVSDISLSCLQSCFCFVPGLVPVLSNVFKISNM